MKSVNQLAGKQILVVEDARSTAALLREILIEAGYKVVGPADTSSAAIDIASACHVDVALLDVHLRDGFSYPVADYLRERGVRFAFLTGHDISEMPSHLQSRPILQKPISFLELLDVIGRLVGPQSC